MPKKINYQKESLKLHKKLKGKIETRVKAKVTKKDDLALLYSPGVAEPSREIHKHPEQVFTLTGKWNTVAVVSDGSAVLGLGNIGPLAALPVMEGKALLFKSFANIDAIPIVLGTQDTEEIIASVKAIAPSFGGINLEDIAAPKCFVIEERLKKELSIPVMHDDQHGTAIVVLAGLINALRLTKKKIGSIRVVINGAGAAAQAIYHLLVLAGVTPGNVIMLDSKGILIAMRGDLDEYKKRIAFVTNKDGLVGELSDAVKGADVFIGVSVKDVLTVAMVQTMNKQPIVFAMANPDPEIALTEAKRAGVYVFGTGRSDYPNQINNVLAFPGLFRGALDGRKGAITDAMKLAAAHALAKLVPKNKLGPDCVIPNPFDPRVVRVVAKAVKQVGI